MAGTDTPLTAANRKPTRRLFIMLVTLIAIYLTL